jgi:hypothetical protein
MIYVFPFILSKNAVLLPVRHINSRRVHITVVIPDFIDRHFQLFWL